MNNALPLLWIHGRFAWPFFTLLVWLTVAVLLWDIAWRLLTVWFSILMLASLATFAAITVVLLWITLSLPW